MDTDEMSAIMENCTVMRLAVFYGERPYIELVNFAFNFERGVFTFYFHSATEGKQIPLIRTAPTICIKRDTAYELPAAKASCAYARNYQSVIAARVRQVSSYGDGKG